MLRWTLLMGLVLALIVVPFVLFGEQIEAGTGAFLEDAEQRPWLNAAVLGGLLAADILLPVPSSIVSTGCGMVLGFLAGTLVSLAGMSISCAAGYALGRVARPAAERLLGPREAVRLEALRGRFGDWLIVLTRPVPVLAEGAVLFAGMGRMPPARFFALSTLANLGISAAYALIGASTRSFLVAFVAAVALSGLFMLIARALPSQRSESQEPRMNANEP